MRPFAVIVILGIALSTPSCVGGSIHGLDEAAWFELLASDGPLPFSAGDRVDYDALERLGPGASLFVAMRAMDRGDDALAVEMLREATRRESGRYADRAAALLGDALLAAGDGDGLVDFCRSEGGALLPPYARARLEATGLLLSGSYARALAAIDALRAGFPAEAARDVAELSAQALEAGYRAGRGRWASDFSAIAAMDGSPKVYEALAAILGLIAESSGTDAEAAIRAVGARTFQLAEARALAGTKEYGPAVVAFRRYAAGDESPEAAAARIVAARDVAARDVAARDVAAESAPAALSAAGPGTARLSPEAAAALFLTLPRAAASDAARAFIAASRAEGADAFRTIAETRLDRGSEPERAYFDAYWYGRFLRADESWAEAEDWFAKAAGLASGPAERDAADWYRIESAWKRSPAAAIAALGDAMAATKNPGYYSDLIEPISREALISRDGRALAAMDAAVRARATEADAARLSYLCARAAQAGIVKDADVTAAFGPAYADAAAYADARMREAYGQRASAWYRLAAAYRLGEDLVDPLATATTATDSASAPEPSSTEPAAPATAAALKPGKDTPVVGPDEYALAMARFGLGARVRTELGPEYRSLSADTVRTVAESLRDAGRHDQAYRLIATLFWRSGFEPTRRDAELYWPKPFGSSFAEAVATTGLDEFLLYGLARSESAFDPRAVSKSGAKGLIQLMPATAAEMAGRLRMDDYELDDPDDNLAIGSAYFARILANVGERVLPAVCSYNAGPTRFRRWEAEYGALPLDLMLEALSYAETRQYGRNVAHAALSYAALYGEGDLRAYFAWLLGEGPRPE